LDGSPIVNVYDDPYIATDLNDDQHTGGLDAELQMTNNRQPLSAGLPAIVTYLLLLVGVSSLLHTVC